DEVVLHALEKEAERRYQQASEVKTAVETIAQTPGWDSNPRMFSLRGLGVGRRKAVVQVSAAVVLMFAFWLAAPKFIPAWSTRDQAREARVGGDASPAISVNTSFGPVIERVMLDNTETDLCMIDLDRNKVFDRALNKVFAR